MSSIGCRRVMSLCWESCRHVARCGNTKTEPFVVAAVPLVYFHVMASYEAKISCWGHMLASSARMACSSKRLLSNGNSTICSLTAWGQMTCMLLMGTSAPETVTSQHPSGSDLREPTLHKAEVDGGLGEWNSRLPCKTQSPFYTQPSYVYKHFPVGVKLSKFNPAGFRNGFPLPCWLSWRKSLLEAYASGRLVFYLFCILYLL